MNYFLTMKFSNEYIKLILGLKLKQLRQEKGLSLSELAKKSGLSVSYLNEIESGKKYPKAEKISALSQALGITYDKLVSLKLTKQLAPIGELLESNLLKILPLDHYGIDVNKLISSLSSAPMQLSALVATIIEMARESEAAQNNFSRTALQTYKEFHDNYFEDLEKAVNEFTRKYKIKRTPPVEYKALAKILKKHFNYKIDEETFSKYPLLKTTRGVVFNGKEKTLLLNPALDDSQKAFIVGRELAYNYLGITERSFIHSTFAVETFDQLLNNFHASYFANALIIPENSLIRELKKFFSFKEWQPEFLISLLKEFNATPEMFFQRTTNLLSKKFGLNQFFFLRFNKKINDEKYYLSKELRLNIPRNPGGYKTSEHYCRRWVSIRVLETLHKKIKKNRNFYDFVADSMRSRFINSDDCFFNISLGKRRILAPDEIYSVTIGFYVSENFKKIVKFWDDPKIRRREVNDTCEMCGLKNCKERTAPPVSLEKAMRMKKFKETLEKLRLEIEERK